MSLDAERNDLRRLLDEAGISVEQARCLLFETGAGPAGSDAELRRSRDELRLLIDTIPQLLWRARSDGMATEANPQWIAYTGQAEGAWRGHGWLDALHPEDRDRTLAAWKAAEGQGHLDVEYRLRRASDGRYRWFHTRAAPSRDPSGRIVEWCGSTTDVHELKTLQQQERVLLAELQHRVRNALAVVRSLARRTAEASETVEEFAMHLDGRLSTLSRVLSAVTRSPAGGLNLEALILEELLACATRDGGHVQVSGPEILLQPKAAETLALAVHELATNAVKFGALSGTRGCLSVTWQVTWPVTSQVTSQVTAGEDKPRLVIHWHETGMSGVDPDPARRGFGRLLLERMLPYEIEAETNLAFDPDGLRCTIAIPLTEQIVLVDDPKPRTLQATA